MDSLLEVLRHAVRRLVRRPAFSLSIVAILTLGFGLATSVFSIVHQVLLHPIPGTALGRLVVGWEIDPAHGGSLFEVSLPYVQDWKDQNRSFEDLAGFGSVNWSFEFRSPLPREKVSAAAVSGSFFDTLRVRPLFGRTLRAEDDRPGAPRVLVLSYPLWQRRFGGDPGVVGTSVSGADAPFTIVGVMPADFDFPHAAQAWLPAGPEIEAPRQRMGLPPSVLRTLGVLYVVGRLKPGVTLASAQADLAAVSGRLTVADGLSSQGLSVLLLPLVDHHLGANTRRALEALAAASGLVLL